MLRKLRHLPALLLAVVLIGSGPFAWTAPTPEGHEPPPAHHIVKAAKIFAPFDAKADASGWVAERWLEIRDGRVVRLGRGAAPAGVEVRDLGHAWIMPGLVDMNAELFIGRDNNGIGPRYVAADKFNPFADFKAAWLSGVTTARLGVPGERFVAGQGSVVKFGGEPEIATVLSRSSDLLVNFNEDKGRDESDVIDFPFPSSSDVKYDPEPEPKPQTRLGRLEALRTMFAEATAPREERDAQLEALKRFMASGRPFRIDARRAADIVQALDALPILKERGLGAYIAGADEGLAVVDSLAAAKIPVVFEIDNVLGKPSDDGWNEVRPWRRDPAAAAALESKGVNVVLGGKGPDLLMAAGIAVGAGLDPRVALEAITSRPAALLGVGDRVGSLRRGRDADYIVLNGDPLSSLSHVQEVWVAGRPAWHRHEKSRPLVVRAGEIHDGLGGVIRDGEILVEDGKIVACGHGVPHPRDARIIDAGPGSVVTPGFIDVHSHLGLENDRTSPGPELELHEIFAAAGPEFADVARAGVTTALVAPLRTSKNGSRMVALKTASAGADGLVAKEVAAVKLFAAGSADQARSSLTGILSKAQKYHATWKKYEEELARFKSGAVAKAEPKKAPAPKAEEKKPAEPKKKPEEEKKGDEAADAISGTWSVTLSGGPMPEPQKGLTMKVRLEKGRVAGTITNPLDTEEDATFSGTFDGKTMRVEIDVETPFGGTSMVAKLVKPENLKGVVSLGGVMDIDLEAKRTKKTPPKIKVPVVVARKPGAGAPEGPKKPKVDARLEPLRAVFDGKAGLIIQVKGAPLLKAVAGVVANFKLKALLLEADGVEEVVDSLAKGVGIALPPRYTAEVDGKPVFVPGLLERRGIGMAFQSSAGWGAARLPQLARVAVREGLGSGAALRALTGGAAEALNLDDTVGVLKPGRDGDILIFNGNPFEARTRLVSVFIRGVEVNR